MKLDELEKLAQISKRYPLSYPIEKAGDTILKLIARMRKLEDVARAAKEQHCGNDNCAIHGTNMGKALAALEEEGE